MSETHSFKHYLGVISTLLVIMTGGIAYQIKQNQDMAVSTATSAVQQKVINNTLLNIDRSIKEMARQQTQLSQDQVLTRERVGVIDQRLTSVEYTVFNKKGQQQ